MTEIRPQSFGGRSSSQWARATVFVGLLSAATLLVGFARDLSLLSTFGVSSDTDAYLVATVIPIVLAQLLVGGIVNVVVVPEYLRLRHTDGIVSSSAYVSSVTSTLLILLIALALLGVVGASRLVNLIAPGLDALGAEAAVRIEHLVFPAFALVGVGTLLAGIANAEGYYVVPALSRLAVNAVTLAGILILRGRGGVIAVAGVLLLATFVQVGIVAPLVRHVVHVRPPRLSVIGGATFVRCGPIALAAIVSTLTPGALLAIASTLGEGAVTAFTYAQRIYLVPVTLILSSLSQTILPVLTTHKMHHGHRSAFGEAATALRVTWLITLPAAVVMFAVPNELAQLVLPTHAQNDAAQLIAAAIRGFSVTLPFAAGVWILLASGYASGSALIPLLSWITYAAVGISAAIPLSAAAGVSGLALATAIGGAAQFLALGLMLSGFKQTLRLSASLARASIAGVATVAILGVVAPGEQTGSRIEALLHVGAYAALVTVCFGGFALLLSRAEALMIFRFLRDGGTKLLSRGRAAGGDAGYTR